MPQFTVEQVIGEPSDWQGQSGPMKSYKLKVSGEERVVELSQIPATAAPTVGQVIEGHIEEPRGNFPPKLRKAKQGGFGGGQSGKDWEASGRAQGRAHAQEMAIRWFGLKGTPPAGLSDLTAAIDWFYDDAQAALAKDYRKDAGV